jgi:hypothetical protein
MPLPKSGDVDMDSQHKGILRPMSCLVISFVNRTHIFDKGQSPTNRLFVQVKAIEQQEFPQKLAFQCEEL